MKKSTIRLSCGGFSDMKGKRAGAVTSQDCLTFKLNGKKKKRSRRTLGPSRGRPPRGVWVKRKMRTRTALQSLKRRRQGSAQRSNLQWNAPGGGGGGKGVRTGWVRVLRIYLRWQNHGGPIGGAFKGLKGGANQKCASKKKEEKRKRSQSSADPAKTIRTERKTRYHGFQGKV